MSADLDWALGEFRSSMRISRYDLAVNYYNGDHNLNFARERFNDLFKAKFQAVAENLCPAVVDSVVDRLDIVGFTSSAFRTRKKTENGRERTTISDAPGRKAQQIWEQNGGAQLVNEVHREALKTGDGFVIVWPDSRMRTTVVPQVAREMAVRYSASSVGEIELAAKLWEEDDGKLRLNLFYPDRIEKYVTTAPVKRQNYTSSLKPARFVPYLAFGSSANMRALAAGDFSQSVVPNPYGRVPVFHFPNRAVNRYGYSELLDVIPLQDALNKSIADLLVAMEFSSFRQRYMTGIDIEVDEVTGRAIPPKFATGADKFIGIENPSATVGTLDATDLSQFLAVQENFASKIARVSGTPWHLLYVGREAPSGDSQKAAEGRFSNKLEARQGDWGPEWGDAFKFALALEGDGRKVGLEPKWEDATPRTEEDIARTVLMLKAAGVPQIELWRKAGYDDDKIDEMLAELALAGHAPDTPERPVPELDGDGMVIATASGRERV